MAPRVKNMYFRTVQDYCELFQNGGNYFIIFEKMCVARCLDLASSQMVQDCIKTKRLSIETANQSNYTSPIRPDSSARQAKAAKTKGN